MPCDTRLKPGQKISERAEEIRRAMERLSKGLVSGSVKAIVSAQGGIVFQGFDGADRDGVTDNCAYRRLMATGSVLAKQKITLAEHMAGRPVNKQVVAQGYHSHDGGSTWHKHK